MENLKAMSIEEMQNFDGGVNLLPPITLSMPIEWTIAINDFCKGVADTYLDAVQKYY